jgi:hypothetical protein
MSPRLGPSSSEFPDLSDQVRGMPVRSAPPHLQGGHPDKSKQVDFEAGVDRFDADANQFTEYISYTNHQNPINAV